MSVEPVPNPLEPVQRKAKQQSEQSRRAMPAMRPMVMVVGAWSPLPRARCTYSQEIRLFLVHNNRAQKLKRLVSYTYSTPRHECVTRHDSRADIHHPSDPDITSPASPAHPSIAARDDRSQHKKTPVSTYNMRDEADSENLVKRIARSAQRMANIWICSCSSTDRRAR